MRANGQPRRSSLTSALHVVPSQLDNVVLYKLVVTTQDLATLLNVAFLNLAKNLICNSTSWGSVYVFYGVLFPFSFKTEACSFTRLRMDAPLILYQTLNSFH